MRWAVRTVQFGTTPIMFRFRRTRRVKTVAISVGPYQEIKVLSPRGLTPERLQGLVYRKAPWIVRRLRAAGREIVPLEREFVSGESYSYLGRQLRLRVVPSLQPAKEATRSGNRLIVEVGEFSTPATRRLVVRRALQRWYRARAVAWLSLRSASWARKLGVARPRVFVRDQMRRWGSCDQRGRLFLNWRMMMAPAPLGDYVIAHEVCHMAMPRHGRPFWRLLGRLMPDYQDRREALQSEGARFSL